MSDCPVNEKYLTKDKINLAVFLSPQAKDLLSETRFFSQERHLSLIASFFYLCFNEPEIIQSLSYLDYTPGASWGITRTIITIFLVNKRIRFKIFSSN